MVALMNGLPKLQNGLVPTVVIIKVIQAQTLQTIMIERQPQTFAPNAMHGKAH